MGDVMFSELEWRSIQEETERTRLAQEAAQRAYWAKRQEVWDMESAEEYMEPCPCCGKALWTHEDR